MNTPLFRPRLATLFLSGCLLASVFPLNVNADDRDRDDRPGFLQRLFPPPPPRHVRRVKVYRVYGRPGMVPPGYTVVYPQGRMSARSDAAYPETGLRMPTPAPDNGVLYSERPAMQSASPQPLQHMEIPADLAARREGRMSEREYFAQPREDESGITSAASTYGSLVKPEKPVANSGTREIAPLPGTAVKEAPKPAPKPEVKNVPVATHSSHPGFVKSPFEPYNELDATGMYSGMLAKDPTTGKIFRMP